jgi:hypothetical protein
LYGWLFQKSQNAKGYNDFSYYNSNRRNSYIGFSECQCGLRRCFYFNIGDILFPDHEKGWKNIETGELCELISFYFPEKNKEIIKTALAEDTEKIDIKDVLSMSTLRLDVYYNKKSDKCFCQLLEFVPYHYSPCSVLYKVSYSSLNRLMK